MKFNLVAANNEWNLRILSFLAFCDVDCLLYPSSFGEQYAPFSRSFIMTCLGIKNLGVFLVQIWDSRIIIPSQNNFEGFCHSSCLALKALLLIIGQNGTGITKSWSPTNRLLNLSCYYCSSVVIRVGKKNKILPDNLHICTGY